MYNIPCVIFAGGKSSRMGEDKALLPFDGFDTLTEFQLNNLSKLFQNIFISCKDKTKFNFDANFIEDQNKELFAPTTAFISIFDALHVTKFFAISVDTPFITSHIIDQLISNDEDIYDATIAVHEEKMQPLCGIYHKTLLEQFLTMEQQNIHKLGHLLKNSHTNFVTCNDARAFLNLNNKEDYRKALQIL